jgi:DNA-binding NtrC family response regulator
MASRKVRTRPVIYQLCRAGERFEVGDGPLDLSETDVLVIGRGDPKYTRHGHYLVDDPWMSSAHAEINKSGERWVVRDAGSTNGVLVNGESIDQVTLKSGDILETGRTFWLFSLEPAELPLPTEPFEFGTWTTWSPRLARTLERLERKVESASHVLITGPVGSGKGFLARTVHLQSGRPGRLVHLDCTERSGRRLAVDLFGSDRHRARLRDADVGTLFLENVEGLPAELQDKLGTALRRGSFTPRGKSKRITFDVRVVASTELGVDEGRASGELKTALLDVIGDVIVELPGLDERRADFGLLLDDFLARARGAPALSRDACRAVLRHSWRSHVKALARVIESAATLAVGDPAADDAIGLAHLPVTVVGAETLRELLPPLGRPPSVVDYDPDATHEGEEPISELSQTDNFLAAVRRAEPHVPGWIDPEMTDRSPVAPPPEPSAQDPEHSGPERPPSAYHDLESLERSYATAIDPELISAALRRSRGNVSAAARYLGRPRALVLKWMREFGINSDAYRES